MRPTEYESALFQKLLYDFRPYSEVRVEANVRVDGLYSRVPRQLDVAVFRRGRNRPFLVADAKRHRRPLDAPRVECFMGMLEDVGAGIGLLASPAGASAGAKRRAAVASIQLMVISVDEALEFNWREIAQQAFPLDWAFHPDMAAGWHRLQLGEHPDAVIDALEEVPFDEWECFVAYGLDAIRSETAELLWFIARHHPDEGWRANALQQLLRAGLLDRSQRATVQQTERDPDILELLEG